MGKGTILPSGAGILPRGQYRVRLEKDNVRAEAESKRLNAEINTLETTIPERYVEYEDASKVYNKAKTDLSIIIQQAKESPTDANTEKIKSATVAEREAAGSLIIAKSKLQSVRLKQRAILGKRIYLEDKLTDDVRLMWCADCQRNLTGTVATIEIPNTDANVLIRPGGANGEGSKYSASRDGQLKSVASMSAAEAAWNFTMFPAWQKFKPLYRLGKITESFLSSSKCSVLLDAYSTAQGLATDVERRLTNVPMFYKGRTDGGPYEMGDRVVIEFYGQNWEAPRVVGFEESPCTTSSITTTTSTTEMPTKTFYLRINLNGCVPLHSGYEIKLACGEGGDEAPLYGYNHSGGSKSLVGPYTVTGCNPYAFVYHKWDHFYAWNSNTHYSVGDRIRTKTAYSVQGILFRCIQAGNSGAGEPDWNFNATPTEDNTAIWEYSVRLSGLEFFWHNIETDALDPDLNKVNRDVRIHMSAHEGLNNSGLYIPATGDFWVKPVYYKRHPIQVYDCDMTLEMIHGTEYEVYNIDFNELMRLHSRAYGLRFHPCYLTTDAGQTDGVTAEEITVKFVDPGGNKLTTEQNGHLPRTADIWPYWIPLSGDLFYHQCGPVDEDCREPKPEHVLGWAQAYALGINLNEGEGLVLPLYYKSDYNKAWCILSDEYGCNPKYPEYFRMMLDDGHALHTGKERARMKWNEEAEEWLCEIDPIETYSTIMWEKHITVEISAEEVPCDQMVPPRFRDDD